MSRYLLCMIFVMALAPAFGAEAERDAGASVATNEGNLRVTSRPADGAPPFTEADGIRYLVYDATDDGHAGEEVDTGYDRAGSGAWFSLPAGHYVVVATRDLARAEARVEVPETGPAAVDIVLPLGIVKVRAMSAPDKPVVVDDIEWRVLDSFGRTERKIGRGLELAVGPGDTRLTASLGTATATALVNVAPGKVEAFDVVLDAATLRLAGKRSKHADEHDQDIRWEVTGSDGETLTDYGDTEFHLAAGSYRIDATLGLAEASAEVSIGAGEVMTKEIVVPTGRVVSHVLFSQGGPKITDIRIDILELEPGPDGKRAILATDFGDARTFDLSPGEYMLRATADVATGDVRFETTAGESTDVSMVLDAGVLLLRAENGDRFDVLASERDIYGNYPTVATRGGEEATMTLPVGAYRVTATRKDGSQRTASVVIEAGRRTETTIEDGAGD